MSRRHSMENLELMKLTPDKMNVRAALLHIVIVHIASFCIVVTNSFLRIEGSKVEQ